MTELQGNLHIQIYILCFIGELDIVSTNNYRFKKKKKKIPIKCESSEKGPFVLNLVHFLSLLPTKTSQLVFGTEGASLW